MLIQSTAQPSPASANVCSDGLQGVEALQLVSVQHFFHIIPEHWLWNLMINNSKNDNRATKKTTKLIPEYIYM